MGNDGGSIPTRRELVKSAVRAPTVSELKATAFESLSHSWTVDPLSSEPLDMENAVSDWRGRLYNYESILKNLMAPEDDDKNLDSTNGNGGHEISFASTGIKSLKDVVKLKFKRYTPAKGKTIWACPVSLKEIGPGTKSVYLVPCGHVFAEVAIKEVAESACPECSEEFKEENVVPILPLEKAELERLSRRIEDLRERGLTHTLKKDKSAGKKKRKASEKEDGDGKIKLNGNNDDGHATKVAKIGRDTTSRVSNINNAMTASLTAKVLAEQEERQRQRKLGSAR